MEQDWKQQEALKYAKSKVVAAIELLEEASELFRANEAPWSAACCTAALGELEEVI